MVLKLVAVIRKELEVDISISDVFVYPTIAGLISNYLEKIKNPLLPNVNIKYLVPLKKGSNKVPLYILAGGGGTSLRFKQFSALLDPDQPVFAFQAPVDGKDLKDFPVTIEGIARKFIDELILQNPTGPYALSGHCLGGFIAFEMARQLEEMGKKVTLLAMFDTTLEEKNITREPAAFNNFYHIPVNIKYVFSKFLFKVNFEIFLIRKHTRQSIRYKVDSLKSVFVKLKNSNVQNSTFEYDGLNIFDESSAVYVAAYQNYHLIPFQRQIVAFYAKEHYVFLDRNKNVEYKRLFLSENTKNMWKRYATELIVHEVKGEHSEIFDPLQGNEFARLLQYHLDKGAID